MRGKQTYSAVQSVSPGITPADAGKTADFPHVKMKK